MKIFSVTGWFLVVASLLAGPVFAAESEVDRLLDLLVEKKILTKEDAVTFRSDLAIKRQDDVAKVRSTVVPEWTQNIKWGGDVRFRTRGDWGKTAQNQPQSANALNSSDIRKQRIQESVRGRFAIEAKVNDFTYAGARFVGGSNSRSTDDTINGYFARTNVLFDQYFIRFEAPKDLVIRYGRYFSDLKLWAGKFALPFETTEMVWDTDITTGGVAVQYTSPDLRVRDLPGFNVYSNIGMLWVDESAAFNTDPLLWGYQVGARTEQFGPLDSRLNISTAFYNFANLKGKTPNTNSAGTNSRTWLGDYGYGINTSSLGTYKYEYNLINLLVSLDNETIADYSLPHGFWVDFVYNAGVHEDDLNKALSLGAYIGKKKLKDPGDWKVSGQWRFIERDAIPDFLPDSNFYGFGTYTSASVRPNVNGLPAGGGTNGKGIKLGFEYQLFKNTALNLSYYWMEPIKSWDKRDPYNQFLFDIIVKF